MSLVSVIIPYFKKKKFIKETVNSVIQQSYKNLEIIIIYDDSSTDDMEYINEIKNLDERIRVIINTDLHGAGNARNTGILNAKGDYIAFLDADDIWELSKIDEQINFMKKNEFKCSHTTYEIIKESNQSCGHRIARTFNGYKDLLKSCDIGLSTVIIKKNVLTDDCRFPNLKTKEDFVLWLKILKKDYIFGGMDKRLTYWRDLDKSLSSSILQKLLDGFRVYYIYMKFNLIKSIYLLICLSLNFLKK